MTGGAQADRGRTRRAPHPAPLREKEPGRRPWLDSKLDDVDALRRGEAIPVSDRSATVDALLATFLDKHGRTVDPATKRKLTTQLKHARREFGDRHPDSLRRIELEDWRQLLPAGSRDGVFRAFRQALSWAVARGLAARDASVGIRNPKRTRHERREVLPFETWADVEAVADELDARYRALPFVAVGCGLRPEEVFGLPAVRAAGLEHRRLYDCRHTFATWAIEGRIQLWYLATRSWARQWRS